MRNPITSPRLAIGLAVLALAGAALPAAAAESASATWTSTQLSANDWRYSLTLTDTGTTDIGTFWFAWIPGQDYIPGKPTEIENPDGWKNKVTGGGAIDDFAIQWVAGSGAALHAGQSLTGFTFESSTSPQEMAGNAPKFPGTPIGTSFVYSGAPFSDAGVRFVAMAAPVPEPSSVALLAAGGLLLGVRVARRKSTPRG